MPVIVLASGSPRRKELLHQIGIRVKVRPSRIEETYKAVSPSGIVKELSRKKAEDIASSCRKGTIVLGADTIVVNDGEILGKPKNDRDAVRMLKGLSGKKHRVYTGVTIILTGVKSVTFSERTEVEIYPMTDAEIRAYIETGEARDKAGAYGIQGRFAAMVRGICGDYTNVVGLPLGRTGRELAKLTQDRKKSL